MATHHRSTTVRDRDRNAIRRTKPPCGICGLDIDYSLRHLDPMSYVVDHVIPWSKGGPDTIENKQAAHRLCNEQKANKLDGDGDPDSGPRMFVTLRAW